MKLLVIPIAVLTASLAAMPLEADEKTKSHTWLNNQGVVTLSDMERNLGVRVTPTNRARMEALLAQRNAHLRSLNDQVSDVLRDELKATDQQIVFRPQPTQPHYADLSRLESIRRSQPMRYQQLLNRLKKENAQVETPRRLAD